jgi:inosose dehydratase
MVAAARQVAALTAAAGAHHLVFLPPMFRDEKTGGFTEPPELDDGQWAGLVRAADKLGEILLDDYDVRLCLHPHADSHIQTQREIERFLAGTDPRFVSLCLDTGHVAYGGGDSVALIREFGERIGYVHVKQVDPVVLARVCAQGAGFGEAVRLGVCVEPPNGVPDLGPVIAELGLLGRAMFVIVEQDLYPCAPDVPLPIAIRTRNYLATCGLPAGAGGRR